MKFNPKKVAFGRHETFTLRYSWLSKGYQALVADPAVFSAPDATVTLGVGKNMVNAIRYWLLATRLIESADGGFRPTLIGTVLFDEKDGYDPYLEDEATIWLLHWLLATNPNQATTWYWFFNKFHKPEFKSQELVSALTDFVDQQVHASVAATTIKNDATIVLRMYARSKTGHRAPTEEALDSPLSLLNLVSRAPEGKAYTSAPSERPSLSLGVLGFAIADLFKQLQQDTIPIEELMYAKEKVPAPGAVFRLTENALITKLECLMQKYPVGFEIRETAGIHQVYRLEEVSPMSMLALHYEHSVKGAA